MEENTTQVGRVETHKRGAKRTTVEKWTGFLRLIHFYHVPFKSWYKAVRFAPRYWTALTGASSPCLTSVLHRIGASYNIEIHTSSRDRADRGVSVCVLYR